MQTTFGTIADRFPTFDRAYRRKPSRVQHQSELRPVWARRFLAAEKQFLKLYPQNPDDVYVAAWDEAHILQALADDYGDAVVEAIFALDGERTLTAHAAGVLRDISATRGDDLVFALFAAIRERAGATAH